MQGLSVVALLVGVGTGVVIGGHGNLLTLVSRAFGAVRASMLFNMVTGLVSGILALVMVFNGEFPVRELSRQTLIIEAVQHSAVSRSYFLGGRSTPMSSKISSTKTSFSGVYLEAQGRW